MVHKVNMELLKPIITSTNKFSPKFFQTLLGHHEKNIICSPIGVSLIASMTAFGAQGKTKEEIKSVLGIVDDDAHVKAAIEALIAYLNSIQHSELHLANGIFSHTGFDIKHEFKHITEHSFRSPVQVVDFTKQAESCKMINEFCLKYTKHHITDIIHPEHLTSDLKLLLLNAAYFKGTWLHSFDKKATAAMSFYVDGRNKQDVPMMYTSAQYNYDKVPNLHAHYIELPYKYADHTHASDAISMFVIIPIEPNGFSNMESEFHNINFHELHQKNHCVQAKLRFPKFKIQSHFDLNTILSEMGMKNMFNKTANLQGITESTPLHVGKVMHKVFVEVNEEGTETGASSSTPGIGNITTPVGSFDVVVDRPFFFAVVATSTGIPLFKARVVNPLSSHTS